MAQASILLPRGDAIRVPPRPATAPAPFPGPVLLMPRRIPGGVAAVLDALPAGSLPRLRYDGPAPGLRRALRAALAERLPRPRWLANWLLADILDQAALMAELTGGAALRVRLDADEAADVAFAAAEARLRLVTSYRGAGTDWVSPRGAAALPPGAKPPAGALRRLPRGDVAVLRGRGAGDGPGVPHRPASGGGASLRLTVEAAGGAVQ